MGKGISFYKVFDLREDSSALADTGKIKGLAGNGIGLADDHRIVYFLDVVVSQYFLWCPLGKIFPLFSRIRWSLYSLARFKS